MVVDRLVVYAGRLGVGPQGHRTVGAIADRLLSAAARASVAQLLQGDLDKFGNPSGRTRGDLHQPLHAAGSDDPAGTRVAVALPGRRHVRPREPAPRLGRRAGAIGAAQRRPPAAAARARYARPGSVAAGARRRPGGPDERALQSNSLARNVAFHYPEFVCSAVPAGIVVLDRAHQSEAAAMVRARLLLAGARLAALLEQALAMPGPTRRQ